MSEPTYTNSDMRAIFVTGLVLGVLLALSLRGCISDLNAAPAKAGYATYYTRASCEREGTSGIMANGQPLDDTKFTCATWNYDFGAILTVRHGDRSVDCVVTDRGPGRKARRRGVIIDLTEVAFKRLTDGDLKVGKIRVTVKEIEP